MNLTRCMSGHFYDADKFKTCPHCSSTGGSPESNVTVALTSPGLQSEKNTASLDGEGAAKASSVLLEDIKTSRGGDDAVTVGFYQSAIGKEPVVGWLICAEGSHLGEDFRLKSGRNFIGRALDMDVVLSEDKSVSRARHAIIVYDPKKNIFLAQPGDARELFYLNDNVVLESQVLQPYDRLTIGACELMFIPFCSERFKWDTEKKQGE